MLSYAPLLVLHGGLHSVIVARMIIVAKLLIALLPTVSAPQAGAPISADPPLSWQVPSSVRIVEQRHYRGRDFVLTYWLRISRDGPATLRVRPQGLADVTVEGKLLHPAASLAFPTFFMPEIRVGNSGDLIDVPGREAWQKRYRFVVEEAQKDWEPWRKKLALDPLLIDNLLGRLTNAWHYWTVWHLAEDVDIGERREIAVPASALGYATAADASMAQAVFERGEPRPEHPGKVPYRMDVTVRNVDVSAEVDAVIARTGVARGELADVPTASSEISLSALVSSGTLRPEHVEAELAIDVKGMPRQVDRSVYDFTWLDEVRPTAMTPDRIRLGKCAETLLVDIRAPGKVQPAGLPIEDHDTCLSGGTASLEGVRLRVSPGHTKETVVLDLWLTDGAERPHFSGTLRRDGRAQALPSTGDAPPLRVAVAPIKPETRIYAWVTDVSARDIALHMRDEGMIDASGIEYLSDERISLNFDAISRGALLQLLAEVGNVDLYDDKVQQAFRPKGTMSSL